MQIGIDFGTTHTSAATYDGQTLQFIPLDPRSPSPHLLRSMIYITRQQQVYLGMEAVHTFLAQDTGREVVYQETVVGTLTNTVASLDYNENVTIVYDTVIDEDVGAAGRLLQSIKTGLRGDSYKGTAVFGRYYSLQELIALILGHVRAQAEAHLQTSVRQATLGRPVRFSDDPAEDRRAEQRLREAALLAGFEQVNFVPEPVAAAAFYLNGVTRPETALIFDFGGGTLDLTLVQVDAQGAQQLLATHGVLLGGDDLDSALMHHCVADAFGAHAPLDMNYDGRALCFPEDLAQHLDQWQTIPLLSRPKPLAVIRRGQRYSPEAHKFNALAALVTQNQGFALFEKIEQSKRRLSTATAACLELQAEGIDLVLPLTRRDFNQAIGEPVSLARAGVREILALAGIAATQVDAVVTTGGSSVIPIFQKMLAYELPSARLVETDAFSSVTSGLAIYARSEAQ